MIKNTNLACYILSLKNHISDLENRQPGMIEIKVDKNNTTSITIKNHGE